MFRRTLSALLLASLLLTACGASEKTTDTSKNPGDSEANSCPSSKLLDEVEVSGKKGEQPTLKYDKPLSVGATACRVLVKGDGPALGDGDTALFDYVFFNARDGSEINTSYGQEPVEVVLDDQLMKGVQVGLTGLRQGSRVLVAIAPGDGLDPPADDPEADFTAEDTLLFVADLREVRSPLKRAEGTAVEPDAGLPTVTLAKDGEPTIVVPKTDPPAELIVQPLIEGKGDEVKSGQSITVHYTGVLWTTGEVFDSSWTRDTPASFPIGTGGVIAGWDKGLVGQRVGSQVLLVIPPADGYPDGNGSIPAGATLVFVVDILEAHG